MFNKILKNKKATRILTLNLSQKMLLKSKRSTRVLPPEINDLKLVRSKRSTRVLPPEINDLKLVRSKRSQVGETITWIVATIIIIVMLLISIFVVSLLNKNKIVETKSQEDILPTKSLFSYLLTKDSNGKTTYEKLKTTELKNNVQIDSDTKSLAEKIFIFHKDIYAVFLRLTNEVGDKWVEIIDVPKEDERFVKSTEIALEKIKLDDDKYTKMLLFAKPKPF